MGSDDSGYPLPRTKHESDEFKQTTKLIGDAARGMLRVNVSVRLEDSLCFWHRYQSGISVHDQSLLWCKMESVEKMTFFDSESVTLKSDIHCLLELKWNVFDDWMCHIYV